MTSRFAEQLVALAAAHIPRALMPADGEKLLARAAPLIAPGAQLYFEMRLAGPDRRVDLSQHFFADQGGRAALMALAARLEPRDPAWGRIGALARAWEAEPLLRDALAEIGLEHDMDGQGGWVPAPAIFGAFGKDVLEHREAALRFVELILPGGGAAAKNLIATLELARGHGMASGRMIGAMLSRGGQLRTMIRSDLAQALPGFLAAAGWAGRAAPVVDLLAGRGMGEDHARVVLGFAPGLVPGLGIEAIHPVTPAGKSAQAALLARLDAMGLAEAERVGALAEWPERIDSESARAEWPDLLAARDHALGGIASHFRCFVNHVKLNVDAGHIQPAKAYLALALA